MLTAITEDSNFFSTCILHASAPAGRERSYTTVTGIDSVESMQSEEQPIISRMVICQMSRSLPWSCGHTHSPLTTTPFPLGTSLSFIGFTGFTNYRPKYLRYFLLLSTSPPPAQGIDM